MAFLSSAFPPHRVQPDITVSVSPSDRARLQDFSIATYTSDGCMQSALALSELPARVDPATGWMWCSVPASLIHPDVATAIALMDVTGSHPVKAFYAIDSRTPSFKASEGPAVGLAVGCFPKSGGLPIPFDSAMTFDTMQTSLMGGTLIDTVNGPRPIEELAEGDIIETLDNGPQPLRAVHSQTFAGLPYRTERRLWPVRIEAGALGFGLPRRDLWISQQQQMLYRNIRVRHVLGVDGVLVQASSLASTFDAIRIDRDMAAIEAFHLVFDAPQVIFAEGAATASYDPELRTQPQPEDEALPQIRSWELMAMVG